MGADETENTRQCLGLVEGTGGKSDFGVVGETAAVSQESDYGGGGSFGVVGNIKAEHVVDLHNVVLERLEGQFRGDGSEGGQSGSPGIATKGEAKQQGGHTHAVVFAEFNVQEKFFLGPRDLQKITDNGLEVAEKGLASGEWRTAGADVNAAAIFGWHVEHVSCMVVRGFMGLVSDGMRGHEIEVGLGKNLLVS